MKGPRKIILTAISCLSLLNIIFIPVFDVWGGLFPDNPEYDFAKVLQLFFKSPIGNWHYWVVQITISILVPSICMLVFSLAGLRKLYMVSSIVGIVLWFRAIIQFGSQNDMSEVLDFGNGSVSIGSWVAIALFVVAFLFSVTAHSKSEEKGVDYVEQSKRPSVPGNQSMPPVNKSIKFCPQCGAEIKAGASFCGKCGNKLGFPAETLHKSNQ